LVFVIEVRVSFFWIVLRQLVSGLLGVALVDKVGSSLTEKGSLAFRLLTRGSDVDVGFLWFFLYVVKMVCF
jgi:hypothetical protein